MRLFLIVVCILGFAFADAFYLRLPGNREAGVFDVDPPTPYYRYWSGAGPRGRLLVVHGLGGNKEMLNPLCYGLAAAGFEVYSIDLPGHGQSDEHFDAPRARRAILQVLDRLGADTNVVGHSLGATLLLDILSERHVHNVVLFSPAPIPVARVQADRLLLIYGSKDLPPIRQFVPELADATGAEVHQIEGAGHTDAVAEEPVIEQAAAWLGGAPIPGSVSRRSRLLVIMMAATLAFGIVVLEGVKRLPPSTAPAAPISQTMVWYAGAAVAAALLACFVNVAHWLHLFGGDYLMAFVFVAGGILCLAGVKVRIEWRALLVAILSAAYCIAVPGLLVVSKWMQMSMTSARLWRFAAIAILSLPLFLADEVRIREIRPRWKSVAVMLITRGILGGIVATAAVSWNQGFLTLMMDSVIYFWIGLWFAGWLIHRRTQDPLSTAVFMSLVQGWLFAVLFVTT